MGRKFVFLAQLIFLIKVCLARPPKIAIIGSGVAGSASTHYLGKVFEGIDIKLFEKSDRIGGRTYSINFDDININSQPFKIGV